MRVDNNSNKININKLCIIILESIKSMIQDYAFLYSVEELAVLKKMLDKISSFQTIDTINLVEENLKELAFRTWKYEEIQGNHFIHWIKKESLNTKAPTISSTFGNVEPFCNSVIGVRYTTNINGFLAAREKDAGVAIEGNNRHSMYTIKVLDDGRVINSYNLGTPIMTPRIAMDTSNNDYKSKHNEIVLDASIAIPVEVVCIDEHYADIAIKISERYNIPYYQDAESEENTKHQ